MGATWNDSTSPDSVLYNVSIGQGSTTAMEDFMNGSVPDSSVSKNVVYPAVMCLIGVIGNVAAIIILTIRPSKDSRATAFYHLVKALVFTDLIGIVASSPVTISVYIKGGVLNSGGWPLCHYFSFILIWAGNSTMFLVLIMACERFLVTKFPFQYTRIVKPLTVNCSILAAISISTIMGFLPIIGMGSNRDHWPGTWCFFDYRNPDIGNGILSFFYAITGLTIVIITIILNVTVIQHLWRMRKVRLTSSIRSSNFRTQGETNLGSDGPDSERRMVIFLMAIIIVFSLCYAPFMVRILMNRIFLTGEGSTDHSKVAVDDEIDLWALRLASFNQLLDPWIYIISRVTCCRRPENREDEILSQSRRSHADSRRLNGDVTAQTINGTRNGQGKQGQADGRLTRTLNRVRRMWNKRSQSRPNSKTSPSSAAGIPLTGVTDRCDTESGKHVHTASDSLMA